MKATAKVNNKCEGYYKGIQYPVLELSTHAMRLNLGDKTKVVSRSDFHIQQESGDPEELINML